MSKEFVFTSTSVTGGHPDKLCDQISDAIVGAFLRQDPRSLVSAECAAANGILFLAVRYASSASVDIATLARDVIRETGYAENGFSARNCTIMTSISELPPNSLLQASEEPLSEDAIDAMHVADEITVVGFACTQTPEFMPLPVKLAHKLAVTLAAVQESGSLPWLAPEGKTQACVEFHSRRPRRVYSVQLTAYQREPNVDIERLRRDLREQVVDAAFADEEIRPDRNTRININSDGARIGGGPWVHSGLTGRKPAVDTYGGYARQSGAALSGKDPSRISRSGAYAARYAAKNVVAAGLAQECELQLTYTLGMAGPAGIQVETFGTGAVPDNEIVDVVRHSFDFRLAAVMKDLRLRRLPGEHEDGFYRKLAVFGHVGRSDVALPWEMLDRKDAVAESRSVAGKRSF